MLSYSDVPKTLKENLQFREDILQWAGREEKAAAALKALCRQDILFWVNTFLWTYDPRKVDDGEDPNLPFVTYVEFQDEAILTILKNLGKKDIGIQKCRDQGASFICLLIFCHQWQFERDRSFMVISRNEKLVDWQSSTDTLFWKLDYMIGHQPNFLVPSFTRTELRLTNHDNHSQIDGASTTGEVGRGGRRTAFLIDEFAAFKLADGRAINRATWANTNCRIFNSTYQGATGEFYDQMQRENVVKISMPWWKHPDKARGMKIGANGKRWSPWYEDACEKLVSLGAIAQEIDMDPQGAASMFFPAETIDRIKAEDVRAPIAQGRVLFVQHDLKGAWFVDDPKGQVYLWMLIKGSKPDKLATFAVGCDISQGTGATNSCLSIADMTSREKVGSFVTPHMSPDVFAEFVVAVCWWLNEAFLIWEGNGPGGPFGKRVIDLGYRNVYYRRDEIGREHKISKGLVPGWHSTPQNKMLLFREYARCLASKSFINRHREGVEDCRQYVYLPTGGIGHAQAASQDDPSGARENHGDIPTADALACKALGGDPEVRSKKEIEDPLGLNIVDPPYMSLAYRRQKAEADRMKTESDGWDTPRQALVGWDERLEGNW
jgi:hypothetical protein